MGCYMQARLPGHLLSYWVLQDAPPVHLATILLEV